MPKVQGLMRRSRAVDAVGDAASFRESGGGEGVNSAVARAAGCGPVGGMKLSFNAREYGQSLELAYLGMQTCIDPQGEETAAEKRYAELEQKLLDLATPQGCADFVTVSSDGRLTYSEKVTTSERLGKVIGNHANEVFWRELVQRLADRDLAAEVARKAAAGDDGPPLDAEHRLHEIEDAYWAEFEKHDLAHVLVMRARQG